MALAGKNVVFTGALTLKRAEAKALAEKAGATVTGSVSGKTDIIVAGPDAHGTGKINQAKAKGVLIWTEADFTKAADSKAKAPKAKAKTKSKAPAKAKAAVKSNASKIESKRLFVFEDSKFWEISISGSKTIVRFGSISAKDAGGQMQTKDHGSKQAAEKAAEKLIKEKTNKGYEEGGENDGEADDDEPEEQGDEENEEGDDEDEDEGTDEDEDEDCDNDSPTKKAKIDFTSAEMTKIAHQAIDHAKNAKWSDLYPLLKAHPGLVNSRPDVREYGVLHQAAWHGDAAAVEKLVLEFGADVDLPTKSGSKAAAVAKEHGHTTLAETLANMKFKGMRQFKVVMPISGEDFKVVVRAHDIVSDLEVAVAKAKNLGWCFRLLVGDQKLDPSASLPTVDDVSLFVENPAPVCAPAQKFFKSAPKPWRPKNKEQLQKWRVGRCRKHGKFGTMKAWKVWKDPRMAEGMDDNLDSGMDLGHYDVVEMTLYDGADKCHQLVGVINEGDADCNTGFWGPLYLRPSFNEVGGIESYGDTESKWEISDSSWYTVPEPPVPKSTNPLCGGPEADTPLARHLVQALKVALNREESEEEDDE